MMKMNPNNASAGERNKPVRFEPLDEYKKENPKCKGCPYGNRQHCVGLCWKDTYDSVLKKRKKTITITETTVITEVTDL